MIISYLYDTWRKHIMLQKLESMCVPWDPTFRVTFSKYGFWRQKTKFGSLRSLCSSKEVVIAVFLLKNFWICAQLSHPNPVKHPTKNTAFKITRNLESLKCFIFNARFRLSLSFKYKGSLDNTLNGSSHIWQNYSHYTHVIDYCAHTVIWKNYFVGVIVSLF